MNLVIKRVAYIKGIMACPVLYFTIESQTWSAELAMFRTEQNMHFIYK